MPETITRLPRRFAGYSVGAYIDRAFVDEYDVGAAANDGPFGLGASVWTNDLARALGIARAIRAGTVWVDTHSALDPAMPFGGCKHSGIGCEFGRDALRPFLETKSTYIATSPLVAA